MQMSHWRVACSTGHDMPRRTLLTPELQAIIIDTIRLGGSDKAAFQRAGISHGTFYGWIQRGQGEDAEQPYMDFVEALTRAKGERIASLAGAIRKAAIEDWRAAAYLLAVHEPETFSEKRRMEHSGPDGGPMVVIQHYEQDNDPDTAA